MGEEISGVRKSQTRLGFIPLRSISSTFVTFNESGTELLVNLGSEQIYLFDMEKYTYSYKYSFPEMRYKLIAKTKNSLDNCPAESSSSDFDRGNNRGATL